MNEEIPARCDRIYRDEEMPRTCFVNVNLEAARFDDVNLAGAEIVNVNLSRALFEDVNLSGTVLRNVNCTGVKIEDAALDGMTINGILVTELFRAYRDLLG